jgi:lipid-binding SYLF domain-containing protein
MSVQWNLSIRVAIVAAMLACTGTAALADWQPDQDDKQQVAVQQAIEQVKKKAPGSSAYFDEAYGYAVLPSITRFAVGFGGAYGKGLVFAQDRLVGKTGFWQFTSGIQAGINNFSMIVFFKDKAALDYFKQRKIQFAGQAGLALGTFGLSGTPSYDDGVAIVAVTRLGLMGEFSYGGIKFTYKDLPPR